MEAVVYQFIEGGIVVIADHLCLLRAALLRVRSQTCNHVGVRVGAVCQLLLKTEKGGPSLEHTP